MNFNLIVKTAVATALFSAASIPAFATSVTPPASGPTPVPGMGPGGLIVEVWDTQTGHSLSEWLGGTTSTFGGPAATPGVTDYGVLGGSAFASTFSSSEIAAGDVQFAVEAANAATATPTVDITVSSLGKVTGSAVSTVAGNLNTGIASTMNGSTACNNVNPCIALNGASDPNFAVTKLGTATSPIPLPAAVWLLGSGLLGLLGVGRRKVLAA
jgi:hypothetical protein